MQGARWAAHERICSCLLGFGPARGWTWGNGTTLSRLHNTDGNASQINSAEVMSFGYDNAFRLNTYTNTTVPSASATYTYDLLDRLYTAGGNAGSYSWTYDADGNRISQTGVPLNVTIDPASNRMTSAVGARTTTYTFSSVQGHFRLPRASYWEPYCLFL